jgi:hypothetical protein
MAGSTGLQPPVLSAFDPLASSEGGIDPLSSQATYEHLAERILPFLTVRMARPRFLTAMAVGAHVCQPFRDEIAADGVTPAYLVYEWYVIEAFVRHEDLLADRRSIPGIDKVGRALKSGRNVSAGTYLKTAKIFGFTGVYRRLAYGLEVLNDDLELDEGGWELLRVWEDEQRLSGFLAGSQGKGAQLREDLRRAVRDGLRNGHTARKRWWHWETLTRHLDPATAGAREADCIHRRLLRADLRQNSRDPLATAMRGEFLDHLERHAVAITRIGDEAEFLRSLKGEASTDLCERLEAIDAYEGLCRPLESAFRLLLHLSTRAGGTPVDLADFRAEPTTDELAGRLPAAVDRLARALKGTSYLEEVRDLLARCEGVGDASALYHTIVDHHEAAQLAKPPDGKRTWFERVGAGIVVRPQYAHPDPPRTDDSYVHWYRTGTASTFLRDLGRLPR